MLSSVDHVRVRALDVAQSADDYEVLLGKGSRLERGPAPLQASLQVGATGLELVRAEDAAGEGVDALVFATPSLDGLAEHLRAHGLHADRSAEDRLVLDPAGTRGARLEVIEAAAREPRSLGLHDAAERLDHAVVLTRAHAEAIALYRDVLGMRLALDRSFEQRGVRILFFRLAGVTLEVAGPIEARADDTQTDSDSDALDRFGGLAWRGGDLIAWRERLLREGFAVSEHRKGHKAGTRVCTVGDRTAGVPTLLIGEDSGA